MRGLDDGRHPLAARRAALAMSRSYEDYRTRRIWKRHDKPLPRPPHIVPTAVVTHLVELPGLLRAWGGA